MAGMGPGGHYMSSDHTFKHFKNELWRPLHVNRENPDIWQQKGGKTYGEIVTAKTLKILDTHKPEPLADDLQRSWPASCSVPSVSWRVSRSRPDAGKSVG